VDNGLLGVGFFDGTKVEGKRGSAEERRKNKGRLSFQKMLYGRGAFHTKGVKEGGGGRWERKG